MGKAGLNIYIYILKIHISPFFFLLGGGLGILMDEREKLKGKWIFSSPLPMGLGSGSVGTTLPVLPVTHPVIFSPDLFSPLLVHVFMGDGFHPCHGVLKMQNKA